MAGCTDNRFEKQIHLYELDLLSNADREQFELHVLECDHCFAAVEQFKNVSRHLLHSPKVRELARESNEQRDSSDHDDQQPKAVPQRNWGRIIRNTLAAAAVLALLVLRPWYLELYDIEEVRAAGNRLVIMCFENLAEQGDPDRRGEIISSLLITDLSDSRYVRVVSTQRLQDILRLLGEQDRKVLDKEIASLVAEKAGADRMLTGSIISVSPQLVLTAQLVDVVTGDVISSQRISGDSTGNVFTLVDRLTVAIKNDLTLPAEALEESDRSVADVTTHSTEAYRHYVAGLDSYSRLHTFDAIDSFEKALEFDSTFAMAYYYLSRLKNAGLIEDAARFSGNANSREQLLISLRLASSTGNSERYRELLDTIVVRYPDEKEAWFSLAVHEAGHENYDSALSYLERAVEIDPLYRTAWNRLAYLHDQMGNFDRAIGAINTYIALAPDEANPYDTRGDIYSTNGSLDKALQSFRLALEKKPDFNNSLFKLGHCHLFKGNYALADSCYRALTQDSERAWQKSGRFGLVYIYLRQGKFSDALDRIEDNLKWGRATTKADSGENDDPNFILLKALIFEQLGEYTSSLAQIESAIENFQQRPSPDSMTFHDHRARLLSKLGRIDEAKQSMANVKAYADRKQYGPCYYHYGSASVCADTQDYVGTINHLEAAAALTRPSGEFLGRYMLGIAYLRAERFGQAVETFEEQFSFFRSPRMFYGIRYVKMHYYLGLAYEESRWLDKAEQQYKKFLTLWEQADPGIHEVEDAKRRLARLKNRS